MVTLSDYIYTLKTDRQTNQQQMKGRTNRWTERRWDGQTDRHMDHYCNSTANVMEDW